MTSDPAMPVARPTLSVVVPTYREAANVPVLFERLKTTLAGLPWEMIVVDDDSSDGTADVAYGLAAHDPRLRCIRRVNRVGLAGAVVEGWLSSSADFVAVIDGDLQHDESILPKMYEALAAGRGNLAIGTRVADQTAPGGLSPARQKLSDLGAWFFRRVAGVGVSDPDERLLHDSPRHRLAPRAAAFARRLQDPRRCRVVRRRRPRDRRNALRLSPAARPANRNCRRWSAWISSGSSSITRPAACCRSVSCCSR